MPIPIIRRALLSAAVMLGLAASLTSLACGSLRAPERLPTSSQSSCRPALRPLKLATEMMPFSVMTWVQFRPPSLDA